MKFFLTGALALSTIAPNLSGMEAIRAYLNSGTQEQPATAQEIKNAQDCSICQDSLDNGNAIRALRCNPAGIPHIYHRQCINNWLFSRQNAGQTAACPICQNPAAPAFSRKERLVANLNNLEREHNPFNQRNREFTLKTAAGSYSTSLAIPILVLLKFKYFDKEELLPFKRIIHGLTTDHGFQIFYLGNFIAEYLRSCLQIKDISKELI